MNINPSTICWAHFGASGLTEEEFERSTCPLREVLVYRKRNARFLIGEGDGEYFVRVEESKWYNAKEVHDEIVFHLRRPVFTQA